jgi:hypothetical protein
MIMIVSLLIQRVKIGIFNSKVDLLYKCELTLCVAGPSYLVSRSAVSDLFQAALGQLYIHLEDVFLTGQF